MDGWVDGWALRTYIMCGSARGEVGSVASIYSTVKPSQKSLLVLYSPSQPVKMLALKNLVPLALFALVSASPLEKRQSSTTCGNNYYSAGQVSDAANAACNYVQSGSTAGSSTYPHRPSFHFRT